MSEGVDGPLAGWAAADLAELVGADFAFVHEAERAPLRLVAVDDGSGTDGTGGAHRSFSLIFRSSHPQPFRQGIQRVRHPDGSEVEIFLVPIGPDAQGQCYQAVFG